MNEETRTIETIGDATDNVARTLVIVPGREAQEYDVAAGTTVGELAAQIGLPNANTIPAYDGMNTLMESDVTINENTEVVNFAFKLAGA